MKPPPFAYHAPDSVEAALAALADAGEDGKVLAGGQSLIPLLNMRLAAPGHLIDINGVAGLDGVAVADGAVKVGATTRHAALEHHAEAVAACPLLGQALHHVAHPVIRNRGTVVGSIAHADPAGELTAVLALLGGSVQVARRGQAVRDIAASDFFLAPLESALEPGDLAVSATFPVIGPRTGSAFVELARRHGDYALCGVAAMVALGDDGSVHSARTACISVAPVPVVLDLTAAVGECDWEAGGACAAEQVEPEADIHATADYRRHLTRVLTARALREAHEHAMGSQ